MAPISNNNSCGVANIDILNNVNKKILRQTVRPTDLLLNTHYSAETIRKVHTNYGDVYLLESEDFIMFMPKRYSGVEIEEFVKNRHFMISGFAGFGRHRTPILNFLLKDEAQASASITQQNAENNKM
ncbi:hypothetical protein ACKWTF_015977 [Chironomus riparius]